MASINIINTEDLRSMKNSEGLVIQGCGGDLHEWIDGINELLTKDEILLDGTVFAEASAFKHGELTNLLFPFNDDVHLNMGKLAMWRIASHAAFGGTWLSDYVDNYLGGFFMSDYEKEIERLNTFADTETSFAFQCDVSGGYPVCLMWNRSEGKAWLSPNDAIDNDNESYQIAIKACEKFGIRDCESEEEFNAILDSLGEDAKNCKIYDNCDETEEQTIC